MPSAKYTIVIPTKDNQKNNIHMLTDAARHWLGEHGITGGSIHRGVEGFWTDNSGEKPVHYDDVNDHIVTSAEDHPVHDSLIKQLGTQLAMAGNQRSIYITKEGKDGLEEWLMDHPNHANGQDYNGPAPVAQFHEQSPPETDGLRLMTFRY